MPFFLLDPEKQLRQKLKELPAKINTEFRRFEGNLKGYISAHNKKLMKFDI
jgi:hypothetical protein